MAERKEVVQYLTWGLLLVVGSFVLFFTKLVVGFPLVPQILGGLIFFFGIMSIKRKALLGIILIIVGAMLFFGYFFGVLKILSILGWLMFIVGGGLVALGIFKVKKQ